MCPVICLHRVQRTVYLHMNHMQSIYSGWFSLSITRISWWHCYASRPKGEMTLVLVTISLKCKTETFGNFWKQPKLRYFLRVSRWWKWLRVRGAKMVSHDSLEWMEKQTGRCCRYPPLKREPMLSALAPFNSFYFTPTFFFLLCSLSSWRLDVRSCNSKNCFYCAVLSS